MSAAEPLPRPHADAPPVRRNPRTRWLVLIGSFALFLGVPEIIVRVADPLLEEYVDIAFGGEESSRALFQKDPELVWKLRPGADVEFMGVRVVTDKNGFKSAPPAEGARIVLCLGDSTTFGWAVSEGESFPAQLEARLAANPDGGAQWSVVNAGVPGYSSFQVRLAAERLIPALHPAVVVVCVGNNEAWPVARSDRDVFESRGFGARVRAVLTKSRFLLWLGERLRPDVPRAFKTMSLAGTVPRVSREEYVDSHRRIVQLAREAGARVVLVAPPVNLAWPPMRGDLFPELEAWQAFGKRVMELAAEDAGAALEAIDQSLAEDPERFHSHYLKGIVLSRLGFEQRARESLERALDLHPYPERCKQSYREAVLELAREEGLQRLDANRVFLREGGGRIPPGWFLDWCHPSADGHGAIADTLFARIRDDG